MSWWNPTNWWKGPPEPVVVVTSDPANAIELATDSIDALHSKRMHLLKKSSDLLKEAKEHKKNGNTQRAMSCMKRKQHIDLQASQMEGQILNLEKTSMMMESTATTVELAHTMKTGSETIKSLLQEVSVDDIEQVADDLNDNMMEAQDLGRALSQPLGGNVVDDDDETILEQMEQWEEEKQDKEADKVVDKLPSVDNDDGGNTKILAKEKEELIAE